MTTIDKLISKANGEIGTKENPANSNKVKYNTAYYGREVNGSSYPWCCVFIWWLFRECGLSDLFYGGKKTAYCPTLMNYYTQKGQFSNTPKVGSLAFFHFGSGTAAKHIGLVVAVNSDGTVTTIEGNTAVGNDSNGGEVMKRVRKKTLIIGYAYPYEKTSTSASGSGDTVSVTLPVLKSGSKGDSVKALQMLLNGNGCSCGSVDGSFGPATLSAVKKFQTNNKLSVDGIVGQNTWKALLT